MPNCLGDVTFVIDKQRLQMSILRGCGLVESAGPRNNLVAKFVNFLSSQYSCGVHFSMVFKLHEDV